MSEPRWRRYLRFFGPRNVDDLDEELRFHVDMRVRDYVSAGMTEQQARAATAARLGDMVAARQDCVTIARQRDSRMRRTQVIDALTQDVRFAVRTLGRQKAWTAIAVVTLGLGIGATTAMYSVVNHLLLNPTPYPGGDRVVAVFHQPSEGNNTGVNVTITPMGRAAAAWRSANRSFEALEPYKTDEARLLSTGEAPRVLQTATVLPSFASFAGERPIIGRVFTEQEARESAPVAMLSEALWRGQFGGHDSIIGRSITTFGKTLTVIGVMPAAFQLPRIMESETDLWLPLDLVKADDDGVKVIARLREGISAQSAAAELDSISARQSTEAGDRTRFTTVVAQPGTLVRFRDMLVLLSAAVALVLLVACANVAHLLLARAATRQREMAIRAAVGAGAGRLFRQLFTESFMLSLLGCAVGVGMGWAGLRAIIALRPRNFSSIASAHMDASTLWITVAVAVVTGLVFGVIGAVQAARHSTSETLKASSNSASEGHSRLRGRGLLVVTEMALCTMLLVGAVLLTRSMIYLQARDPGFDASRLYAVGLSLPEARYPDAKSRLAFYRQVEERTRALPGIAATTIAGAAPLSSAFLIGALQAEGQPDPAPGTTSFINYNGVTPEYFRMIGMRFVLGATFTDTTTAAAQAIVNEAMARSLWPGQPAVGRKLRVVYNGQGQWKTVVGVVADALTKGRTDRGEPMLYLPGATFYAVLLVRTSTEADINRVVSRVVTELDPSVAPPTVQSVEDGMRRSMASPRFTMLLLSIFAGIAVALAAVGLYGVLAYSVAQRTREIGIRVALGATRGRVAMSVMGQGMLLAAVGAVLGLIGARWGASLVGSQLYGVRQTDPLSFGLGAAALVTIAALACVLPVRRAVRVDPIIAMRAD
jgi:putative ABC transport system permease protein